MNGLSIKDCANLDARAGFTLSSAAIHYSPEQMKIYEIGFRSYISLKKREIRKKINRAGKIEELIDLRAEVLLLQSGDFEQQEHIRKFGIRWEIRVAKILAIYQSQLTALDKQLNS
jgi:hypothetical protein